MWETMKLCVAVFGAVWLTLVIGGGVIWLLGKAKREDRGPGKVWSMLQLIVLVCTVLTIGWKAYWVLHPSKQEVQWQRGTDDYGLN